ncbi:MAG: RHS repeat-associated core domain-containing protein [Thermoanaerobaculia bacterium]
MGYHPSRERAETGPIASTTLDLESARTAAGYLVSIKADSNALDCTFDDADRIQRIVRTNGAGLDIVYDGRGFMARADLTKQDPPYGHVDVWTQSTYDSDGVLRTLQRRPIAGGAIDVTNILYFSGLPIAQWKKTGLLAPTTTWVIPDHLGTPAATLTSAGALDWFGGFEPFGTDWQKGGAQDSITKGVFLRMPGQWTDSIWDISTSGIQLHYNLNRWYEQQSGRYTRVDPLGRWGDRHPFGYARSTSTRFVDPLGLDTAGCDVGPEARAKIHSLTGLEVPFDSPCVLKCCAYHDACYNTFGCDQHSWLQPQTQCNPALCSSCNETVVHCITDCANSGFADPPNGPYYYCAKLGKFVSIPGDFETAAEAANVCRDEREKCCNKSKK